MSRLPLVVTPGMGVGPEVTARAVASLEAPRRSAVRLIGRAAVVGPALDAAGLAWHRTASLDLQAAGLTLYDPGDRPGEATEAAAIRLGAEACLAGRAAALVTGPIHKARLVAAGFTHRGHTDYLGTLCGVDEPVMAFAGGELRVALVTHHLPLMQVGRALTPDRIVHAGQVALTALRSDLGIARPRIAVCGLNPHAGEGGLLGSEEQHTIGPACDRLRSDTAEVVGPVSAETAFLMARRGETDLVLAMYHDQGLAPLKAVDFGRSVNWTLGLPIVRTSVDHGTADALVGTGRAEPDSMRAALELAWAVVRRRQGQSATSPVTTT